MNEQQRQYYRIMASYGRLIPIVAGNKLLGMITYYITMEPMAYIERQDPWTYIPDDINGIVCYVDQVITNHKIKKPMRILTSLAGYICETYPKVEYIEWRRYKNGKTRTHKLYLNEEALNVHD